jgi:hypothetical protein
MVVPDPFDLGRDRVESFIPGNTFEFSFAPFPDPLEGVEDAIRRINPLPQGPAPLAGPKLRLFAIVSLDPGYYSILYVNPQKAGSAAMAGAHGGDYQFISFLSFFHCWGMF